jgi:hypothetical protein
LLDIADFNIKGAVRIEDVGALTRFKNPLILKLKKHGLPQIANLFEFIFGGILDFVDF